MNLSQRLIRAGMVLFAGEKRSYASDWLAGLYDEPAVESYAGKAVSPERALGIVAVYSAVLVLSETMGSLPTGVFKRQGSNTTEPAEDHPLWDLLHNAPNERMTATEFKQVLQGHLATWGNGYAEVEFNPSGDITALWPLRPDRVEVKSDGRSFTYEIRDDLGRVRVLPARRVFHVRGFGFDGTYGYSPIGKARQMIGAAMATEEFGARFFSNGAVSAVGLKFAGKLEKSQKDQMRKSFDAMHAGSANAWKTLILDQGLEVENIGIPPKDAQFLELRGFGVEEVARLYRIPPHMLQHLDRATFNNIAELGIGFLQYTMLPWIVRWDQALQHQLMTPQERRQLVVKHNVRGLLRGNLKEQGEYFALGRQWGFLSINDIRALDDMPPVAGGDVYHVPLNMVPLGEEGVASTETDADPEPLDDEEDDDRSTRREVRKATRSAAERQRISVRHRAMFRRAFERLTAEEVAKIRSEGLPTLNRRDSIAFDGWLEDFYGPEGEARKMAQAAARPSVDALGDAIRGQVAEEVDGEPESFDFDAEYLAVLAVRWAGSSKNQIKKVTREAIQAGEGPAEAIEERISEWEEKRPGKEARNEAVRFGNALAKTLFVAAGFSRFRWITIGKNCPYCSAMDGRTVNASENFLGASGVLSPAGARPFTSRSDIGHPPLHGGCDCMIAPSL